MGSEAFVASGDKEKAERVSRNERPTAATIEAADAARRRETSAYGKIIVLSENSISRLYRGRFRPRDAAMKPKQPNRPSAGEGKRWQAAF